MPRTNDPPHLTGRKYVQRLQAALDAHTHPNRSPLTELTRVPGFPEDVHIVSVSAGYSFWLALARDGRVFACDTGFDGYAGTLPTSLERGGWQKVNEVRP